MIYAAFKRIKWNKVLIHYSTTDRRSIEIELTDRGKTLFNDIENNMDNKYKEVFERISVEEKSKVLYSLKVVVDAFEESENSCSKDCCCHKSK